MRIHASRSCIHSALLLMSTLFLAGMGYAAGNPPRNLRVTAVTDWSVALGWDAPNGRAPASYFVQCSNGRTMSVPGGQTSATFTAGFSYIRTYSFRAYAVGSNGDWSNASNTVTATLLKDVTPPTKPVVSSTGAGPTHVDLSWTCHDGDPNLRFDVYVNDALWFQQIAGTSKIIVPLTQNTSYSFQVRARDAGGNWSPISDAILVTTPAADPNDHQPPSMPPGFYGGLVDTTEAMVFWSDSTDNVTHSEFIRYELYLNGQFDGATVGIYPHQFSTYLTPGIVNTIEVYAIDEAGNRSVPATMTIDLRSP